MTLLSCNNGNKSSDSSGAQASRHSASSKTMAIITNSKTIRLSNTKGSIIVKIAEAGKDQSTLSYVKKEWREWCEIGDKDEDGVLLIKVRNSSFTGDSGCELEWSLTLRPDVSLEIEQAAGNITGTGALKALSIKLAAGQLTWSKMAMPVSIEVAAGNIELQAQHWPEEGSSNISVATGNVSIKSPKGANVSTQISKAMGIVTNDFPPKQGGHSLKIDLALGKVSHLAY